MNTSKGILIIIAAILLLLGVNGCSSYNRFVDSELKADERWANVESQYQRRLDLIANLVKTVQGAADFERSTLQAVVDARSKAGSVNLSGQDLNNPEMMQQFETAQAGLSSALSRLLVVVERYPDLKATQNFRDLQAQLEGTENRIQVARADYNNAVKLYNQQIRRFPGRFWAGMFGFEPLHMFQSQEGAERSPEVEFNF